jgi:hypothetical protein
MNPEDEAIFEKMLQVRLNDITLLKIVTPHLPLIPLNLMLLHAIFKP